MIVAYCNDELMFCRNDRNYAAEAATLTESLNTAATAEFTLPASNMGSRPTLKSSIVRIERNGVEIFRGSVSKIEHLSLGKVTRYTAESALAWLQDVIIDPISADYTAQGFVTLLCNKYNVFAKGLRCIEVGTVDVSGTYNPEAEKPTSIWDYLSGLKSALGGYISLRYDGGKMYLDYTTESGGISGQHIVHGTNLLSLDETENAEDYCTRIYPIGKEGTLINSVNANKPTLVNEEAEELIGCVINRVLEVDSDDPATIKAAGEVELAARSEFAYQVAASAVDRSAADPSLPPYSVGQWAIIEAPCISTAKAVQIVSVKLDLAREVNPEITLGSTPRKLSTMPRSTTTVVNGNGGVSETVYNQLVDRVTQLEDLSDSLGELDTIESQGTTGVWTWRKWSNGVAECWCSKTISKVACTTAVGSWYRTAELKHNAYPFTFAAAPVVNMYFETNAGTGALVWTAGTASDVTETQQPHQFYLIRMSSSSAVSGRVHAFVRGKYK